ncbi:hypothetical protein GF354_04345 [Candidatus Peregrinibacteria bacterium]|nr:hypothetical protein [Candidatus Peregrinibacteria bacterium]
MQKRQKNLLLALLCSFLTAIIFNITAVFAADIPITVWVSGQITFTVNGDWTGTMGFSQYQVPGHYIELEDDWVIDRYRNQDYITFVDDNSNYDGFHINFKLTNFVKDASNVINASNFKLIGADSGSTPVAATKCYDDSSCTLSINTTNSCRDATTSAYTLNSSLTSSPYYITGSTSDQTLITTSINCINMGHIRFDRTRLTIPSTVDSGTYNSTMTLTMIDGT